MAAWWAMKAFEVVSWIRINLDETKMYSINTDKLNALVAYFPIKYLGLRLHDRKLPVKSKTGLF